MRLVLIGVLIVALEFCFLMWVEKANLEMTLQSCYDSGELISPEGKEIQCLWLNSDKFADKGK